MIADHVGKGGCVEAEVGFQFDAAGVATTAGKDHAGVTAKPRHVHANNHVAVDALRQRALRRNYRLGARDKTFAIRVRKHSADTDLEKVRVFAVIFFPLFNLCEVDPFNGAGVEGFEVPPSPKLSIRRCLAEAPAILRRVTELYPEDFCILVRHSAFGNFVDYVRDRGRLIEKEKDAAETVVQSGKGFRVMLRPRHNVDAPCVLVLRIGAAHGRSAQRGKLLCDGEAMPLCGLNPRLRLQLVFSVGRDHASRIDASVEGPIGEDCSEARFSYAVARRSCNTDGAERVRAQRLSDKAEGVFLPRAQLTRREFSRLPPRISPFGIAKRIVTELRQLVDEYAEVVGHQTAVMSAAVVPVWLICLKEIGMIPAGSAFVAAAAVISAAIPVMMPPVLTMTARHGGENVTLPPERSTA